MNIIYRTDTMPTASQVIELYNKAGLPRPTNDPQRIQKMYEGSNLIVTAWHNDTLVGACRCITDWAWSCYLADLAVDPSTQKLGIGKEMVQKAKEAVGEECMILLLSVPGAMTYYPKIGFAKEDRAFMMKREK